MIVRGVDMPVQIAGVPLSPEFQQRGWFLTDSEVQVLVRVLDDWMVMDGSGEFYELGLDSPSEQLRRFVSQFLATARHELKMAEKREEAGIER